jgi:(S)-2-hydroxyglutarate dehydrogenase
VGCAVARAVAARYAASVAILEAENRIAAHQTGNNSGVIHSGLYYTPGSLKARNCTVGREALYRFCEKQGIPHERCGKLVIATREAELGPLEALEQRGLANGLKGLRRVGPEEIREIEPHIAGIAGLKVTETGIVDYHAVTRAYTNTVKENGGEIMLSTRFLRAVNDTDGLVLETDQGTLKTKAMINCAGLQCDRVARNSGVNPELRIVPFRGEYYDIVPKRRHLIRNLVYPVPDPRFPFLGVHFTRMVHGGVEAGPNAVLALKREGYRWRDISLRDIASYLFYAGFWRMARRYWRVGFFEVRRSLSRRAFVDALRRLMPDLCLADVTRGGAGVRAQALEPSGKLSDDFKIISAPKMIHLLNAPSPAATASIAIGETIANLAGEQFSLTARRSG